ncbi:MAG: methyltransferase domain-containing protein, partial [Myxococcota bacterium]|nr:methyltransferase domain-containing protein [Myxococcota bacterium]
GIRAGQDLLRFLEVGDRSALERATATYDSIIPQEPVGLEYPALLWVCRLLLADEAQRAIMLENPHHARFHRFVQGADGGLDGLIAYLRAKYGDLEMDDAGKRIFRFADEVIRYNGPGRWEWEGTEQILEVLDLQPGQAVVDLGAGAGFYTFHIAEQVGPEGQVTAIEINKVHVKYINGMVAEEGIGNVRARMAAPDDIGLEPDSVDTIFLCVVYQAVYGEASPEEQERLLGSIRSALRSGGRLVVVENTTQVVEGQPHRGTAMHQTLVASHLEAHGFELLSEHQFTPSRVTLVFEER